jgi:hypothetical protein
MSQAFSVFQVFVNGTATTFDRDGTLLTVDSLSDLTNPGNVVVISFVLYYTTEKTRVTEGLSGIPNTIWLPRVSSSPNFTQSVANVIDGVFTLSGSDISIIAPDKYLTYILTDDSSIYGARVRVWMCIGEVSTNKKVFNGECVGATFREGIITFTVIDAFNKLQKSASFGDKSKSRVFNGSTNTPYPNAGDVNTAIPLVIGASSPFTISGGWRHLDQYGSVPNTTTFHVSDGYKAIKATPQTIGSSTVVEYVAARFLGTALKTINLGTISAAYRLYLTRQIPSGGGRTGTAYISMKMCYLTCSATDVQIGDYLPPSDAWGSMGANVVAVGTNLWDGHNVLVCEQAYGDFPEGDKTGDSGPLTGIDLPTFTNNVYPSMCVWIEGGDSAPYYDFFPRYFGNSVGSAADTRYLRFTASVVNTYTFNGYSISTVAFEIDPALNELNLENANNQLQSATIRYRFSPASEVNHADAMKFIVESSGMSTNSTSFTTAASDLSANVAMTVPLQDGGDFPSYLEVAQAITKSSFGILRVNTDDQVEYVILKPPGGETPAGTRDTSNILEGSFSSEFRYQDIVNEVVFQNDQYKNLEHWSGTGPSSIKESLGAKYLHGVEKSTEYKHVLTSIQSRDDAIIGYLSRGQVEYTLTTAHLDLNIKVGDVIIIKNDGVDDEDGDTRALVTSISVSRDDVRIKLNSLRGLP